MGQKNVHNMEAIMLKLLLPPRPLIVCCSSFAYLYNHHLAKRSSSQAAATTDIVDLETDNNHDTPLTLACVGGHASAVELLIKRGADVEHRDKKGFTPLILAATGGHTEVCKILLEHGCKVDAQSERTKDTALSLACSGGRKEV